MGRGRNKNPFNVPDFLQQSMEQITEERVRQQAIQKAIQQDASLIHAVNDPNGWSLDEAHELKKATNVLYRRSCRALNIYRPVPSAVEFHRSMAGEIGIVGSNRAGKSVAAAVEISWAATGTHPIVDKYPVGGMDICMLGPRLEHLRLFYRMYFGTGRTFKILKDGIDWVVPRWDNPEHVARIKEWQDAPPLIPPEMVDGEPSWYDKKSLIPQLIKLTNGTTFYFFSMEQDPPRGVPFHLCLSKDSEIYDPVADCRRRIEDIREEFHVISYNRNSGLKEIKKATKPFIKGVGEQLKVWLSNGEVIYVARGHEILSASGEWVEITKACDDGVDVFLPACEDGCLSEKGASEHLRAKCQILQQSSRWSECDIFPEDILSSSTLDGLRLTLSGCEALRARRHLKEVQDSLFCCHSLFHFYGEQFLPFSAICRYVFPLLPGAQEYILSCRSLDGLDCTHAHIRSCAVCDASLVASVSSFCLSQCLPRQSPDVQHLETCRFFCICQLSSSCRLCTVCEPILGRLSFYETRQVFASLCQPPETISSMPANLSRSASSSIQCYGCLRCKVCEESLHLATASSARSAESLSDKYTYHSRQSPKEKMTTTNQCHVIRYEIIGNDLVYDISVEDNHNYIYGGIVNHNCGIDEEAPGIAKWLSELRARFISVMGKLIWSSTPESSTQTFWDLKVRSERPDMADKVPYKRTQFFELSSKDNPYLPPLGLEAAKERLEEDDPDAAAAKIDGEWSIRKFLVYPEFNENIHVIDPFEIEWRDTVYLIIDPGRTRNGTLFAAIIHHDSQHYLKEQPDRIVFFDELLMETARDKKGNYVGINAQSYARRLMSKLAPYKHWIEDITFDFQQGRKKDDYDVAIMDNYRKEMETAGILPRNRAFVAGYKNIDYGVEEVSKFLSPPDGQPPKIAIMRGKCPQLVYGIKRYQREQLRGRDGKIVPGKPIAKRNEMVDCLRYACCRGFTWMSPPSAVQASQHLTGQELARLANDDNHFVEFMFRDYYSQFNRKPVNRR